MATSGSFDTTHRVSGSYNTYAHFDWWQTGQSTANNTTSIDWTFSGRTASSHQYIYVYGASVTVDGSTKSGWSGNMYNGTQMLSGSKTITHNSDGTKTFGASGYITQYSSSANYSGSGSWTLNTIPRKATLKTYPDFNDEGNPTITYENKAGTSVSSLQACISLTGSADDIAYRDVSKTGTSYTFNLTQAERNVLLNATKTSKTRKVNFFLRTIIGGNTFYDSKEVTFSVVNANPTFSNFTYADTNSTTTAITGNNQYIIQGKSTLRATIASANKATANKNATMVQYDFAIADYAGIEAYTTSNINKDIGVINASVDQTLKVVARDSRDNTTTVQKNVNIVPYASPSIIATATRQSNFESNTTIHIGGAMSLLSVAGVTKNAVDASNGIKWRYKESTSSTWGSWTNVASTTSADGTVSVTDFVRTFDNKKAWDLQFSITDKLETKTINVSLGQGQPQFFIGSDGRSSVGGLPSVALPSSNTGQLEVYGDVYAKNLRSAGNAYANGNRLAELPITKDMLGSKSVTSDKIDWESLMKSGEWVLVDSASLSSDTSGTTFLRVIVPTEFRGANVEYRLAIGAEFLASQFPSYPYLNCRKSDGGWEHNDKDFSYMRTAGVGNNAIGIYTATKVNPLAFEWVITTNNCSCEAEVIVGRAGTGNFWNATGRAGGFSDGGASSVSLAARTQWANSISAFRIECGRTITLLKDSHMSLWARKTNVKH